MHSKGFFALKAGDKLMILIVFILIFLYSEQVIFEEPGETMKIIKC